MGLGTEAGIQNNMAGSGRGVTGPDTECDVEAIALYGRWKSIRSSHDYLRREEVFLMRVSELARGADWERV